MKKHQVNSKFFEASADKSGLKSLSFVCKEGRRNGNLNLSNRSLNDLPMIVFSTALDDDEKFWELVPLSKLDLSFNQIRLLPLEITTLTELSSFKMRNNIMSQLPKEIFSSIQKLNHLDLSFNKLESLDDSIGSCFMLKELLLSNNRLTALPMSISRCSCLTVIDMQDNMLDKFPNIYNLSSITSINLSNNNITDVPIEFGRCSSLKSIELRKNRLSSLPNLDKFMSMTYLDLTENCLSSIPVLPQRGALDRLYFGFNRLKNIDALCSIVSVSEVKVNNNIIDVCPNLEGLVSLKMIDLSNNNLADLHPSLGFLVELLKILVDGNPIRTIRRTLLHGSTHDLKAFLRTRIKDEVGSKVDDGIANVKITVNNKVVNITENNYKTLVESRIRDAENKNIDLSRRKNMASDLMVDDDKVQNFIMDCLLRSHFYDQNSNILNVVSINFEGNNLTMQSLSFFNSLPLLKILNLRGNRLGSAVNTVFRSSNHCFPTTLSILDVSSNSINDDLILQIIYGINLERLFACSNNLTIIPTALAMHSNLKEIDLSMNSIKTTNFAWYKLAQIESINLSGNKIEMIEPIIESILSSSTVRIPLRTLKLENNSIKEIPTKLGLPIFDGMRELTLHGNPIKSIPFSTIDRGCDRIREVLKNRM